MKSEKDKMLAGELYRASDPELVAMRRTARHLLQRYNATRDADEFPRRAILDDLMGSIAGSIYIEPPFYCDYGKHIHVGDNFYANFGCTILDCAPVRIGRNVFFAPHVQIYPATHPLIAEERNTMLEYALPITIGNNVWIGGGAIILPGVTIGDNTTIGAGSVVTRDIPSNVVAAGNPCRILRQLEPPAQSPDH